MNTTSVSELAYIELGVTNIDAWKTYAIDVLGVSATTEQNSLLLKLDDSDWRMKIVATGEDDIRCAGFRVHDEEALQSIVHQLAKLKINVTEADSTETIARGVSRLIYCEDPFGLRIELFIGTRSSADQFTPPSNVSGFVTGDQGLGHIVLFVDDEAKAINFYQAGLGFLLSDNIVMGPEGSKLNLTFLHCNPRHHTLALVPAPVPKKLNHLMLQVNSIDDVGFGFDRATEHGTKISSSLGCHTNDKMISFYMETPSGFDIEYGYGGVEIDDSTWETTTYDRPSIWGHKGRLN